MEALICQHDRAPEFLSQLLENLTLLGAPPPPPPLPPIRLATVQGFLSQLLENLTLLGAPPPPPPLPPVRLATQGYLAGASPLRICPVAELILTLM